MSTESPNVVTVEEIAATLGIAPGEPTRQWIERSGFTVRKDWAGRPALHVLDAEILAARHRRQRGDVPCSFPSCVCGRVKACGLDEW